MIKIDKQAIQKICSWILLTFVMISIGFMLGKHSVKDQHTIMTASHDSDHIAVYYLHSTFRCETCNTIENMTRDLLNRKYINELKNNAILWQEVDFMENTEMAKQFDIAASCVVVAQIINGNVHDYQRLDKVWTLIDDPGSFDNYISKAIDSYLIGK